MSPAFPPNDSPETIAAAYGLGIQHPPGYPLAALVGRVAIVALPLGSPAWRVNLGSALLAVMVASLAGLLAWRLAAFASAPARLAGALLAGLGLGLWKPFWLQATEAKGGIYLLALLCCLGLLHAKLGGWRALQGIAGWRLAGLWAGLALADHFLLAAPLLAAVFIAALRERAPWGHWRAALWMLLPGLSVYLYLPLRAAWWPGLDLGHPDTLERFWWVLSREAYSQAGAAGHLGIAWSQTLAWWSSLWRDGFGLLPLLGGLGAWACWRHKVRPAWTLALAWALAFIAGAWVNKTYADMRFLSAIFLLPADALAWSVAGVGSAWGLSRLDLKAPACLALALFAATALGAHKFEQADRSQGFLAWDYGHDLALSLPRGALYFGEGDFHVFPLLYQQLVEEKRGDLAVVVADLAGKAWHQQSLGRRHPSPAPGPGEDTQAALAWARAASAPVLASPYGSRLSAENLGRAGLRSSQHGLARALKASSGPPAEFERAYSLRPWSKGLDALEPLERQLLPWYAVTSVQAGNEAQVTGRPGDALRHNAWALGLKGDLPYGPITFNLGLAHEALGQPGEARRDYQRALELDPGFGPARERLAALGAGEQGRP